MKFKVAEADSHFEIVWDKIGIPHVYAQTIEDAYKDAKARLKKVESHLADMEDLGGVDKEWLSGEF